MLWIFDEECERGDAGYLLFDGILFLLRQRCRIQNDPGQLSIASGAIITGPGIRPVLPEPKTGLLRFAVKGHEMTPFQISRISWRENEEDSESGTK